MKNTYIVKFNEFKDKRGSLLPFEYKNNCPFEIKRIFIIYNVPQNIKRGEHINIKSKNLLVAIKGSCKIKCSENNQEEIYTLNSSNIGLFIDINVYREIYDFDNECILLCISDKKYDKEEYLEGNK